VLQLVTNIGYISCW